MGSQQGCSLVPSYEATDSTNYRINLIADQVGSVADHIISIPDQIHLIKWGFVRTNSVIAPGILGSAPSADETVA